MNKNRKKKTISFFFATSGHSGVDRIAKNLIFSIIKKGFKVKLLKIKNHGPYLKINHPNLDVINFNVSHVYSSFFWLIKFFRKENPPVMLTDKDRVNRIAILAKTLAKSSTKLFVRIGTTVSVNLSSRGFWERFIQKNSMKRLYKFAEKVIVPSKGVAYDMEKYIGLPKEHIEVIPSPIIEDSLLNKTFPPPNHKWFKPKVPPVILGVGELCTRKDFSTLIKAFKIVLSHIDARLVILGRGKQRDSLIKLSENLGIRDKVDFPGFISNPYPYMAHAKVFVLSSLWEGLPVSPIEALAMGTPVVSTNCPSGPSEILENGKYGPLVPPKDYYKMAEAIIKVLKNPLPSDYLKKAITPYLVSNATEKYLKVFGLK